MWTEEDEGSLLRREVVRERLYELTGRDIWISLSLGRWWHASVGKLEGRINDTGAVAKSYRHDQAEAW